MRNLILSLLVAVSALALAQDKPETLPQGEIPKDPKECAVCVAKGSGHGAERVVAGARYKGSVYYFCAKKELAEFMAEPESFLPPVLPRPAPELGLADGSGKLWDAEALRGKVVLVDFWATWCKPCEAMKPTLLKLREKFAGKGFEVLAVSIDEDKGALDKYLAKHKPAYPVLHDASATWQRWKVRVVPTYFLVADGVIVGQWSGITKLETLEKAVADAYSPG